MSSLILPSEAIWAPGLRKASPSSSATSSLLTSSSSGSSSSSDIEAYNDDEDQPYSWWTRHKHTVFTLLVSGGCILLVFGIFTLLGELFKLHTTHINDIVIPDKSIGKFQDGDAKRFEKAINERHQQSLLGVS